MGFHFSQPSHFAQQLEQIELHRYPFVLNATIGNLIALAGSFVIVGPCAQFQCMLNESRHTAAVL